MNRLKDSEIHRISMCTDLTGKLSLWVRSSARCRKERSNRCSSEKDEYYWQFLGHFLGRPDVDKLYYVIYDGYVNDGRILEMNRADHVENIKKLYDRIRLASEMIDESIRSGLDLLDCVDKAKEVLKLKMQIEALKPEAKNSVPVKNQIYKIRKELKKLTKKVPSQH